MLPCPPRASRSAPVPGGGSVPGRHLGGGQIRDDQRQVEGEVLRDLGRGVDGVRCAPVKASHVRGTAQPVPEGGQMAAGALQVGAQPSGGQDIGQMGVGRTRAADRTGGEQREPVSGCQSAEGIGDGCVCGTAVHSELDGERIVTDKIDEFA